MQQLLASLVVGMSVKDSAFKAGMAASRAEVRKTGQEFDRGADTMSGAIERAAIRVNDAAIRMMDSLAKIGDSVRNAGLAVTVGLTLPLGALAHASNNTASDFEAAMNRVHSAMVNASPEELDRLSAAALTMGPAVGKSAIEAAQAIEALAKNGLGSAEILGGGLKSALTLAVVGQTDLGKSSDLTTDLMQQFGKTARDLPDVVNKVSGALDVSKLAFDDYRLAAGQAGGLTGALGYSFEDFNVALAAAAPLFDSGADAGTSFRSFLTSLNAKSKESEIAMERLGLSFYNADGSAKALGDIAEQLRVKLGNLNDRSKGKAIEAMFGVDGGRTALALMKVGLNGIEDAKRRINDVSADQKTSILLDGEAAATQRAAAGWERLKIAIGGAGIIQAYTAVKNAIGGTLNVLASSPPWFFKLGVAIGALAAATGPLILVVTSLAKIALPLLLLRLGPLALGLAAIINPVGVLIRLLGALAVQAGTATLIGRLGTSMLAFAGPIGLAVTALSILVPLMIRTATVSDTLRAAQSQVNDLQAKGAGIAMELANATGKQREEALKAAQANRAQAVSAVAAARADLEAAKAANVRMRASVGGAGLVTGIMSLFQRNRMETAVDYQAAAQNLQSALGAFDTIDNAIKNAGSGSGPKIDMSFDADPKAKKKAGGKSAADLAKEAARNEAQYQDEIGRSRVEQLNAQADLTASARARYAADMAQLAEDRASMIRQNATNEGLNAAQRAALLAEKDKELFTRRAIVEQTLSNAMAQESYDLAKARNDAEQDAVRAQADMADSVAGRRDAELRLLELQRQQEVADLDLILATKNSATAEWANADKRKAALDGIYGQRADAIRRNNEGPAEGYMRSLNVSAAAMNEQVESIGVSALKDLNSQLSDAILGTRSLASAFADMGKRIMASLIDIAIQQSVIKPLAASLFGGSGGSGGGLFGSMTSLLASTFGGGKAKGGGIDPSSWYVVGEKGPEVFAPGVSGTVIPNGGRGSGGRGGNTYVDMRGAMVDTDVWAKVDSIASYRAGEAYQASATHTETALAGVARQRL